MATDTTTPDARRQPRARPDHSPDVSQWTPPMVARRMGVHTMSSRFRVRLVKRDGSKTRPTPVDLDPDFRATELREHLVGLGREHAYEDGNPERWAPRYALEVLHHDRDDVLHVYRPGA